MTTPITAVPRPVAVLDPYVRAGVFGPSEVHLAAAIARLGDGVSELVILGVAVAARGPRLGHGCVDLADVGRLVVDSPEGGVGDLPWPDAATWARALEASDVVAGPDTYARDPFRPLVWDGRRLYLQRYWDFEVTVADDLRARARARDAAPVAESGDDLVPALDLVFGPEDPDGPDLQRAAVRTALTSRVSVLAGGPGTGKTRTIAALLTVARLVPHPEGTAPRIALAAPTGKAATRMSEAVQQEIALMAERPGPFPDLPVEDFPEGMTLHRLLGWMPGTRFRHDRGNPLPYDMVIVDETSMVSLPLMARLLSALRPSARLVLVGDPFQLASIEAGSVLSDVVGPATGTAAGDADAPLAGRVTTLLRMHRYAVGSSIAELADAVRGGDADGALDILAGSDPAVRWILPDDEASLADLREMVARAGAEVVGAALVGDAARGMAAACSLKVLCATRHGPWGLYQWGDRIESDVALLVPEIKQHTKWYVGRPVMVTANDPVNRVVNGEVGLVVRRGSSLMVAIGDAPSFRYLAPSRLDRVESWWAMTIHKSQGSEYPHAVLSLPAAGSPILTRELLYTGLTRAKERVTIVASEAALRAAIDRPIARASGLRDRLWPDSP